MAGLYIHIPFCHSKCAYCDFFSTPIRKRADAYIDALRLEWDARHHELGTSTVNTIYIGGGTPSILSIPMLEHLFAWLPTQDVEEFTIEVNPEDVTDRLADFLRHSPVTRVSMGVQSLVDSELKTIGRRHTAAQAIEAAHRLRHAGIDNLSLDLIYGLPGQTSDSWLSSVKRTLELNPQHLSAYSLMLEPGTRLWAMAQMGKFSEVPQEMSEAMYHTLCRLTARHGMKHYEISNFAMPGFHSLHNSSYWNLTPYLGLGAAAHSFDGITRHSNPSALHTYLADPTECFQTEHLTRTQRIDEYLMIRLRTAEGIDLSDYEARWGVDECRRLLHTAKPHIARNLLVAAQGHLYMNQDSWLLTDSVLVDLFPDE